MNTGHYDQNYLFNNYKFYYPVLNNIVKTISLSDEFMREFNNEKYKFRLRVCERIKKVVMLLYL